MSLRARHRPNTHLVQRAFEGSEIRPALQRAADLQRGDGGNRVRDAHAARGRVDQRAVQIVDQELERASGAIDHARDVIPLVRLDDSGSTVNELQAHGIGRVQLQ